jgi:hypothetical protein
MAEWSPPTVTALLDGVADFSPAKVADSYGMTSQKVSQMRGDAIASRPVSNAFTEEERQGRSRS